MNMCNAWNRTHDDLGVASAMLYPLSRKDEDGLQMQEQSYLIQKNLVLGHQVADEHIRGMQMVNNICWVEMIGFAEVISPSNPYPQSLIHMFLYLNGNLEKKRFRLTAWITDESIMVISDTLTGGTGIKQR